MAKKILTGHISPETAYVVNDYPYGFRLRCKIRYWIEKVTKGAHKDQCKLMSQTTNPKLPSMRVDHFGKEVEWWHNQPKNESNCYYLVYMTLDDSNGHVDYECLSPHCDPKMFTQRQDDILANITREDDPVKVHDLALLLRLARLLETASRRMSPETWKKFDMECARTSGYKSDAQTF